MAKQSGNAFSTLSERWKRTERTDFLVEVGIGCDFYLRYFKLIPELKFCYSLGNSLDTNHPNELTDVNKRVFATSVDRSRNQMFVFTLYFE